MGRERSAGLCRAGLLSAPRLTREEGIASLSSCCLLSLQVQHRPWRSEHAPCGDRRWALRPGLCWGRGLSTAGIRLLLRHDVRWDYCILLSEQDYPLRANEALATYLWAHRTSFVSVDEAGVSEVSEMRSETAKPELLKRHNSYCGLHWKWKR